MNELEKVYRYYKVNLPRLLHWLQLPKQDISPQVAIKVIQEVAQEIKEGKKGWEESSIYPEPYRKKLEEGAFPEHFWIDNYILQKCRMEQDNMLVGGKADQLEDILQLKLAFQHIAGELVELDNMLRPIKNFFTVPNYLKPKTWKKALKRIAEYG